MSEHYDQREALYQSQKDKSESPGFRVLDYDNLPLSDVIAWLGFIKNDVNKAGGFVNVKALKIAAIDCAIKRLTK